MTKVNSCYVGNKSCIRMTWKSQEKKLSVFFDIFLCLLFILQLIGYPAQINKLYPDKLPTHFCRQKPRNHHIEKFKGHQTKS